MQRHLNYFSHFGAIGFPINSQIEFERLLKLAFESGQAVPFPGGKYVCWSPGEGVELWVKVRDRSVVGCAPYYRGEGRLTVALEAFHARSYEASVTDGALSGAVLPAEAAGAAFPIIVDLPGFEATVSRVVPPQTVTLQATAFALEMNCVADAAALADWRDAQQDRGTAATDDGIALAEASLTARVLRASLRTNPITQQNFLALVVQAPGGGTLDIVASHRAASGELIVGGTVQGDFWISGSILDATSSLDVPGRSGEAGKDAPIPVLSRLTNWVRGNTSGG
ncbi:MAG: hypothetical protein H7Z41_10000 [Cytophagales bacterium]|nr:hypothetical protein [Armatimonadota bacterium]